MDNLELFAVILGDSSPSKRMFGVEAPRTISVDKFKGLVHAKRPNTFARFDAPDLVLWKLNTAIHAGQVNEQVAAFGQDPSAVAEEMNPAMDLSHYFISIPPRQSLHIIVQLPSLPSAGQKRRRSLSSEDDDERRLRYFRANPAIAPSTRGDPSTFAQQQKDPSTQILCGRPSNTHAPIPIALLHPVFGEFSDNAQSYVPTEADNVFAWKLATTMSGFYPSETARAEEFRGHLNTYGIPLTRDFIPNTQFHTDGSATVRNEFFYIITEAKLEVVKGTSDPLLQAVSDYLESLRTKRMSLTTHPCFLVYYYGAVIGFAGAVLTDKVSCQLLTPVIPFNFHPTDDDMLAQLARILGAFKRAANQLREYYVLATFDHTSYRYPYPRSYRVLDDHGTAEAIRKFEYHEKCDGKLVFFAKDESGAGICVKFSRRYSRLAHSHAAEVGLAPKLLGFQEWPGGWFMSIMEFLGTGWEPVDATSTQISAEHAKDFRDKLAMFHAEGFVHGDIRESNLFVRQKDAENTGGVKLVDFEWSGKHGEVRYPACLTRAGRPDSVRDGVPILKDHDDEAASLLFKRLHIPV